MVGNQMFQLLLQLQLALPGKMQWGERDSSLLRGEDSQGTCCNPPLDRLWSITLGKKAIFLGKLRQGQPWSAVQLAQCDQGLSQAPAASPCKEHQLPGVLPPLLLSGALLSLNF